MIKYLQVHSSNTHHTTTPRQICTKVGSVLGTYCQIKAFQWHYFTILKLNGQLKALWRKTDYLILASGGSKYVRLFSVVSIQTWLVFAPTVTYNINSKSYCASVLCIYRAHCLMSIIHKQPAKSSSSYI